MPLEKTEAVVLKLFNWAESSRTAVFFSRHSGKLALVDKAGRSLKSKRGRLIPFARMEITYYSSEKESRGYLSEVELLQAFPLEKEGTLGRLAFASAACELLYLLLPEEEPQVDLYHYFLEFLHHMESAPKRSLAGVFLAFFIRFLSYLGYHPSLDYCVRCRSEVAAGTEQTGSIAFSSQQGGVVCLSCQKPGEYYIPFSFVCYKHLVTLEKASLREAAAVPMGYQETVLLVDALVKFISFQTGLSSELQSLEFLEKLKNSELLK
jgi:DNA repair protein RecO (recombination protein O)